MTKQRCPNCLRQMDVGIYVSGRAQKEVTPAIGKWLNERS